MNLNTVLLLVFSAMGLGDCLPAAVIDDGPQVALQPLNGWWFVPDGRLPGRASRDIQAPTSSRPAPPMIDIPTLPMRFKGQFPTERQLNLWSETAIPHEEWTVEMWAMYHVDQPVGAVATVRSHDDRQPRPWLLSFYDWHATLQMQLSDQRVMTLEHHLPQWTGFKERWVHVVATATAEEVRPYVNGTKAANLALNGATLVWPDQPQLEVAAYMANEPYWGDMQVRPLVPICEQAGVDLMMFGHLHLYERSFPIRAGKVDWQRGVVHLLAGGGGGNLEDFGPTPAWFSAKTFRGHHYLTCEVAPNSLTFRMFDLDGRLRDQWQMKKPVQP